MVPRGDERKRAMQRNNKLGALAFGVELPNGKQAYPTSPSWMLYGGDDAHCMDNVPVLIRPETFCSVFTAEARVFRCIFLSLAHIPRARQLCWILADSSCSNSTGDIAESEHSQESAFASCRTGSSAMSSQVKFLVVLFVSKNHRRHYCHPSVSPPGSCLMQQ